MPRFIHQLISTQCSYSTPCCHPSPPTQKKAETRSGGWLIVWTRFAFSFHALCLCFHGKCNKTYSRYVYSHPQPARDSDEIGFWSGVASFFVVVSQCKHLRRCTCATGRIHGRCPDGTGKTWEELKIVILVWLLPLVLLCPCHHPFPGWEMWLWVSRTGLLSREFHFFPSSASLFMDGWDSEVSKTFLKIYKWINKRWTNCFTKHSLLDFFIWLFHDHWTWIWCKTSCKTKYKKNDFYFCDSMN